MKNNLAILIPTYKRPERLKQLLKLLNSFDLGNSLMIYVAENLQSDLVQNIVSQYPEQFVRYIPSMEFYDSAEGNLLRSWDLVEAEYIWILGDDDVPSITAISDLIKRCKNSEYAAFKYNGKFVSNSGQLTQSLISRIQGKEFETNIGSLVRSLGFWHSLAGFSTWVIRKDTLSSAAGLSWMKMFKSPIYSHVTYLIKELQGKKILFVNENLVEYRINDYVDGGSHWLDFTTRTKIPEFYPWTLGFIAQLNKLIELNCLEIESVKQAVGDHFNSKPFLEINSMINLTLMQIEQDLRGKSRYELDVNDLRELFEFFSKIKPGASELLQFMEDICIMKETGKINNKNKRELFQDLNSIKWNLEIEMNNYPGHQLHVAKINGYDVYFHNGLYFSVLAEATNHVLNYITVDMVSSENRLVNKNLDNLINQLLAKPFKPNPDVVIHNKPNKRIFFLKRITPKYVKKIVKKLIR